MTEPQIWTVIGILGVAVLAAIAVMSWLLVGFLRAEIGRSEARVCSEISGLRSDMDIRHEKLAGEIQAARGELLWEVGKLMVKTEHLDLDARSLFSKTFGDST